MHLNKSDRRPYICEPYYNSFRLQCGIDKDLLTRQFKRWAENGKAQSEMTEICAQDISFTVGGKSARFVKTEKEFKDIDGHLHVGYKKYPVSCRTLTSKALYQGSSFIGGHRRCTPQNLVDSLNKSVFTIVCDIRPYGSWTYWLIDNKMLLEEIKQGFLDKNGHTRWEFFAFLEVYGYILEELVEEPSSVRFRSL